MKSVEQLAVERGVIAKYTHKVLDAWRAANLERLTALCEAYYQERLASEPVVAYGFPRENGVGMKMVARDVQPTMNGSHNAWVPLIAKPKEK